MQLGRQGYSRQARVKGMSVPLSRKSGVAKPHRGEKEKNLEARALHPSSALLEDAALGR